MKTKTLIICLVGYLLMSAFTYGYVVRNELRTGQGRGEALMGGWCLAWAWPIFWPFHLSRLAWEDK